jgi:hypothetical protein
MPVHELCRFSGYSHRYLGAFFNGARPGMRLRGGPSGSARAYGQSSVTAHCGGRFDDRGYSRRRQ